MLQVRGFTLIELLIAIAIFSVIGTASYQILSGQIRLQKSLDRHGESLYSLQRAIRTLSQDIAQYSEREIRKDEKNTLPSLKGTRDQLSFTKTGWSNFSNLKRPESQRVLYRLNKEDSSDSAVRRGEKAGQLEKVFTLYLDTPEPSSRNRTATQIDKSNTLNPEIESDSTRAQTLLANVTHLQFSYIDSNQNRHDRWPLSDEKNDERKAHQSSTLNKKESYLIGIELQIESEEHGRIHKVFSLSQREFEQGT